MLDDSRNRFNNAANISVLHLFFFFSGTHVNLRPILHANRSRVMGTETTANKQSSYTALSVWYQPATAYHSVGI